MNHSISFTVASVIFSAIVGGLFTYKTRPLHDAAMLPYVLLVHGCVLALIPVWFAAFAWTVGCIVGVLCEEEDFEDERTALLNALKKEKEKK